MGYVVKLGQEPPPGRKAEKTGPAEPGKEGVAAALSSVPPRVRVLGGGALAVILLAVGLWMAFGRGSSESDIPIVSPPGPGAAAVLPGAADPGFESQPGAYSGAVETSPPSDCGPPDVSTPSDFGGAGVAAPAPDPALNATPSDQVAPGHTLNSGAAGGVSVTTEAGVAVPGAPGMPGGPGGIAAPGAGVQYGPRPPVRVPKPGGGTWTFEPREDPS